MSPTSGVMSPGQAQETPHQSELHHDPINTPPAAHSGAPPDSSFIPHTKGSPGLSGQVSRPQLPVDISDRIIG